MDNLVAIRGDCNTDRVENLSASLSSDLNVNRVQRQNCFGWYRDMGGINMHDFAFIMKGSRLYLVYNIRSEYSKLCMSTSGAVADTESTLLTSAMNTSTCSRSVPARRSRRTYRAETVTFEPLGLCNYLASIIRTSPRYLSSGCSIAINLLFSTGVRESRLNWLGSSPKAGVAPCLAVT